MKKLFVFIAVALLLSGCATRTQKLARRGTVIPQPEGFYVAIGQHKNAQTALQIALASAEIQCKNFEKQFVVYNNQATAEKGFVSEKAAKGIDIAAAGVANVAGRFVPGANMLRGTKTSELRFKCE